MLNIHDYKNNNFSTNFFNEIIGSIVKNSTSAKSLFLADKEKPLSLIKNIFDENYFLDATISVLSSNNFATGNLKASSQEVIIEEKILYIIGFIGLIFNILNILIFSVCSFMRLTAKGYELITYMNTASLTV